MPTNTPLTVGKDIYRMFGFSIVAKTEHRNRGHVVTVLSIGEMGKGSKLIEKIDLKAMKRHMQTALHCGGKCDKIGEKIQLELQGTWNECNGETWNEHGKREKMLMALGGVLKGAKA